MPYQHGATFKHIYDKSVFYAQISINSKTISQKIITISTMDFSNVSVNKLRNYEQAHPSNPSSLIVRKTLRSSDDFSML